MKIVIEGKCLSWNKIYALNNYWRRKLLVDSFREHIQEQLLVQKIKRGSFLTKKVDIEVTAYFKNTIYDSDNIPAKLINDALKGYLFKDDTTEYIGKVSVEAKKGERDYFEIEII